MSNEKEFAGVKMYKLVSDDPNAYKMLTIPVELLDRVRIREVPTYEARTRQRGLQAF
jgi:hypothetical protein